MRATTGFYLWEQSFRRDASELLALEEELSQGVAAALGLAGSPRNERAMWAEQRINMGAYTNYLRGRSLIKRAGTVDQALAAANYFAVSVSADGQLPMARNSLCSAYVRALELGAADEWYSTANEACTAMLLQNPSEVSAHFESASNAVITFDSSRSLRS